MNTAEGIGELFDLQPIRLDGFTLKGRSAIAVGRPNVQQFEAAVRFAAAAENASPYWIGDLLRYGADRHDWRDRLDQIIAMTGLAEQTVHNRTSIANRVQGRARELSPSLKHSEIVAPLEPKDQEEWLDRARTEGWGTRDLERELRASRRRKVLEGQADLAGRYRVIYAAPPWSKLSITELARAPVQTLAAKDAVLFLWVPVPVLLQNPGAREVIEGWGFEYKTNGVWDRVTGSFGSYLEIKHEHLIIATRGDGQPDHPTPAPGSIFRERRVVDFISRPKAIRTDWIQKLYRKGPYLELFGAEAVKGWTVYGDDPKQWGTGKGLEA